MRLVSLILVLLPFGSAIYWVFLGLFHRPLMGWLYGGQYLEYANLMWLVGFVPVFVGVGVALSAILRSIERPDGVFWAYLLPSIGVLTAGLVMVAAWGIVGAVIGMSLSSLATGGIMAWFLLTAGGIPAKVQSTESTPDTNEKSTDPRAP